MLGEATDSTRAAHQQGISYITTHVANQERILDKGKKDFFIFRNQNKKKERNERGRLFLDLRKEYWVDHYSNDCSQTPKVYLLTRTIKVIRGVNKY